ncbi:hypothetical protein CANMA_004950 [Candida margitis]|uniref:uncharacterized protein n=1 Tax=Candida margitis TaxID=1775924 RepID=UPI0022263527|nr:uncharacterized protein CANMA_004950 [Candida margitis]KAI5954111.1 hypothetical protein CANMA_004950 [Candida margitis]
MHASIFFLLPLALSTIIPANLDLKARTVGSGTQATEVKRDIQSTQTKETRTVNKRDLKSTVLGGAKKNVARDSISANDFV